jgi:hypothetical protein
VTCYKKNDEKGGNRSEFKAVRSVVKRFPLEVFQLCPNANTLYYGRKLHRMSAFLAFCSEWLALCSFVIVSQYTSDAIAVVA